MHQVEIATTRETLLDSPEMTLNMGPQHPSTHGVLRIILRLDGETVIDLDCDIGFLHRGMEKIAENRLYPMIAPYWDRLDYIAAVSNGLVWVETVEQMLGLEVPPRAHYIRTVLTELNRIASHLLWLATHGLDIGAFTVLLWALREREEILKIFEQQFGARLTCHARSEEHTSELQSRSDLVCRLLLEKKKNIPYVINGLHHVIVLRLVI